jgi:hypothetical protein
MCCPRPNQISDTMSDMCNIGQHISDTLSAIWPVFCYTSAGLGQRVSGVPDRIART